MASDVWLRVAVGGECECWPWLGSTNRKGYGTINRRRVRKTPLLVHRVAYEDAIGPIPVGQELHHVCLNPACCNPMHLTPVTPSEHSRLHARAACVHGHPFDEANTYWRRDRPGRRECRTCTRERVRRLRKGAA